MFRSILGAFLAFMMILGVADASQAAEARAQVGEFKADGTLVLDRERFRDRFEDGTRIAELKVEISNGFYYVTRKGYANGSCRKEAVQLSSASGQPVTDGSTVPNQLAFLIADTTLHILDCEDDGCHALKWVVPIGAPPLVTARCDRTELSENRCRCHLNDGSGMRLTNGDFCDSFEEVSTAILSHWVHLVFIDG